jgi:hypothetical protein
MDHEVLEGLTISNHSRETVRLVANRVVEL